MAAFNCNVCGAGFDLGGCNCDSAAPEKTYELRVLGKKLPMKSLLECSREFRRWIVMHDLGSSDLSREDGEILFENCVVARVSYNGRVWDNDGRELKL